MLWLLHIFTPVAHADVDTLIRKFNTYLFNPLILLMVVLGVVYFLYGVFEYMRDSSSDDGREKGQRHMLWGLIGLSIMVGVFLIMRVILGTIGLTEEDINVDTGEVNIGNMQ